MVYIPSSNRSDTNELSEDCYYNILTTDLRMMMVMMVLMRLMRMSQ